MNKPAAKPAEALVHRVVSVDKPIEMADVIGSVGLRPDQLVRLELLRIVNQPMVMRDAGSAVKRAAELEQYVMNGQAGAGPVQSEPQQPSTG